MTLFSSDQDDEVNVKLEDLVGEGKKFSSVDDLVKKVVHQDKFINQLTTETKGMRETITTLAEDLKSRKALEELVEQLGTKKADPPISGGEDPPEPGSKEKPEDVSKLVESKFNELTLKKQKDENLSVVKTRLRQEWGADYVTRLKEIAVSLNVQPEQLDEAAASNPKVFYRLVGLSEVPAKTGVNGLPPSRTQVNTSGFKPNVQSNEKNWEYYENMRKNDPAQYWTSTVQNQILRDAEEQGERFGMPPVRW